jgi:hypothetical protein
VLGPAGGDQAAPAGGGGNTYYTEINAGPDRSGAGIARDFEYHTAAANRGPGM